MTAHNDSDRCAYSPDSSISSESSVSLLSTDSGSMVEIARTPSPEQPAGSLPETSEEDGKYRLIYSKSKVYVNPTAYARDNIPGFVTLVKRESVNPVYLLAWIPETLLSERGTAEWDKLIKVEEKQTVADEDEDAVLIELPTQRPESYTFSVPLTSIYSLLVYPPSLSSWYGSIGINLINGTTLPTLYFHDDESPSFSSLPSPLPPMPSTSTVYPPPPPPGAPAHGSPPNTWGGDSLLSHLRSYAHLLRSNLDSCLFLVDPSRADIEAHSAYLFDDDAVDNILAQTSYAHSHSPVPNHRRPRPLSSTPQINTNPYSARASVLHRSLHGAPSPSGSSNSQARMALLQSFSNITRATRHAAQNILSHPLAKPIVPHLPDPVKSLVNANGEWEWGSWVEKGGMGEFESARVYLARWARVVAEEGERARVREAQALPTSSDAPGETSSLGVFELLHSTSNLPKPKPSRDPSHPIDLNTWNNWFAEDGRPKISEQEMKREVFGRGLSSSEPVRKAAWPFILGVYRWDTTTAERELEWEKQREQYNALRAEWDDVPEVFDRPDILEERHRIDVDCRRTDRTQPLFSTPSPTPDRTPSASKTDLSAGEPRKRPVSISPNQVDIGAQSPSNEHIERLASVLLTYHFYHRDLGYVQGMSDLCAPVYVVMDADEEMTFWCFVKIMDRMKQNFLRDQSGMRKQLSALQQLIHLMDPELYLHFEKADALNLFFCFRWVLIAFKREFPFEDVLRLWEILWTDYYSDEFVLFVALAVIESHRDVILRYLKEFDEVLKYCNDLSMTIELDTTLAQAEVLFLSFAQLVADIDRRNAEIASATKNPGAGSGNALRNRGNGSSGDTGSSTGSGANQGSIPLSKELRDLLKAGARD